MHIIHTTHGFPANLPEIFQNHLELRQKDIRISSAGIAIQIALSEARQQGVAVAIHLCRCQAVTASRVSLEPWGVPR